MGLPENFSRVRFDQPARAELNLSHLGERLPDALLALLPVILAQVPDPDTALNTLERFSRGLAPRVAEALSERPVLLHYLLAMFSHSRYLTETLLGQPELLLWLARDHALDRMKSAEGLSESFARFEATAGETEPAVVLARFKRREYLRIALKDILRLAGLTETTHELSLLTDVLVGKALAGAAKQLERRHGWPHTEDELGRPVRSRFAVVSLGKLGGNELNYSSDIDLLFLYDGEGQAAGGESGELLSAREFFLRLGQDLMKLIAGLTPEGPVFRVDLRLRPGGAEGDLVVSLPGAVHYYRTRAREWERQMLLKARHTAGDEALVREFLQQVEPVLFEPGDKQVVVAAVLESREQMDRKLARRGGNAVDVKLSPGGIRDIEFLVQCLQRLHGGPDRWVRSPGTLLGLQRLADKGYLSSRDHHELAAAYQFLRLVEHRLQLDQGQQTHSLPNGRESLVTLAARCETHDFRADLHRPERAAGAFLQRLDSHRSKVSEIRRRVLLQAEKSPEEPFQLFPPEMARSAPEMEHRTVLREIRQRSEAVYRALLNVNVADEARRPFQSYLSALLASPAAFDVLSLSPELLNCVAEIFDRSKPVGEWLTQRPDGTGFLQEIDSRARDGTRSLFGGIQRMASVKDVQSDSELLELVHGDTPVPEFMSALRRWHGKFLLHWGLEALAGEPSIPASLSSMSGHASMAFQYAWDGASPGGGLDALPILLGRVGLREMDLGSDLDILFVAADEEAQKAARPVAEKCIHFLSAYTSEGALFQVDARLRPDGQSGDLVQTETGFLDYLRTRARVWEAAAYLKASPLELHGHGAGRRWWKQMREVLLERFCDLREVRDGLSEMRFRLETEGAGGPENFKTGPGGLYDIDFILALIAFRTGILRQGSHPLMRSIYKFGRRGELTASQAGLLSEALNWFRTVDHAIRLVTGKSAAVLPAGRRGEIVAELSGRWLDETLSAATLATKLAELQQRIRAVYETVFSQR